MFDIGKIHDRNLDIRGHCRIDYKDPITGKVKERIEGPNHVFIDQFAGKQGLSSDWENMYLVLTNGTATLDEEIPIIPGRACGYANPSTAATGRFQGAYIASESYRNRATKDGIENLYTYEFLASQIPDTIRYVGFTYSGLSPSNEMRSPFSWGMPFRVSTSMIVDMENNRVAIPGTVTIPSNTSAGAVNFELYTTEPLSKGTTVQAFEMIGEPRINTTPDEGFSYYTSGSRAYWGYDLENRGVVFFLRRWIWQRKYYENEGTLYCMKLWEDVWRFSEDGLSVAEHFEHESYPEKYQKVTNYNAPTDFPTNYPMCVRMYNGKLYCFGRSNRDEVGETVSDLYNSFDVYTYDCSSGEISVTNYDYPSPWQLGTWNCQGLFMYKGLTFTQPGCCNGNGGTGTWNTDRIVSQPIYDVYNDEVYSDTPIHANSSVSTSYGYYYYYYYWLGKNLTATFKNTWYRVIAGSSAIDANTQQYLSTGGFALTAYQLPGDAPKRPENTSVTVAYSLNIYR